MAAFVQPFFLPVTLTKNLPIIFTFVTNLGSEVLAYIMNGYSLHSAGLGVYMGIR